MGKYIYLVFIVLLFIQPVYAYIDPGTGSMLFSIVLCLLTTLFYLLNNLIIKLKNFVFSREKLSDKRHKFVIYSEGRQYYCVFKPIADEFEKRKVELMYYTSSEDDPIFDDSYNYVKREFIGKGNKAFFKLAFLNADICLMTTPQLDVLQLKRSKNVKHYSHIFHSIGSSMGYKLFGLDYYDSVLCDADFQIPLIRELEGKRHLPPKECSVVGSSYMDYYEKVKMQYNDNTSDKTTVVVAPSWGNISLLNKYGEQLLNKLKETDYRIIVRPHPQSSISDKDLIGNLMKKFENTNIEWDFEKTNLKTLSQATILISDYSSVMLDFAFLYNKPFLYVETNHNFAGRDCGDLDETPWIYNTIKQIGREIKLEYGDLDKITDIIEEFKNNEQVIEKISQAASCAWKYRGCAAEKVADFLIDKQMEISKK